MTRRVTIEDIRELSRRSRLALYGDTIGPESPTFPDQAMDNDPMPSTITPELQSSQSLVAGNKKPLEVSVGRCPSKPLRNALLIMRTQAEHDPPFLFRHEAAFLAGVQGGASLLQAEKQAIHQNVCIKHELPRARTQVCFWEITDLGYDLLELSPPQWRSKGDYKHKFCAHRTLQTYERYGHSGDIEHRRPNGKLVDVMICTGEHVIYVEVCASWPIEKELTNIEKDLDGDPLPSEIILAVSERKMKNTLQRAISEMEAHKRLLRPVRVALAGDLIEFLEIEK